MTIVYKNNVPQEVVIKWNRDDVLKQAKEDGIDLTWEEIGRVMVNMDHYHDANVGICWDVISVWIAEVVSDRCSKYCKPDVLLCWYYDVIML